MSARRWFLSSLLVTLLFGIPPTVSAQFGVYGGDDFDPAVAKTWVDNKLGWPISLPRWNNGKPVEDLYRIYHVYTSFSGGNSRCQYKAQGGGHGSNFTHKLVATIDGSLQYGALQQDVDEFWDHRFGAAKNPPKTTRISNADLNNNCYRYVLQTACTKNGSKWGAVMDQVAQTGQVASPGVPSAFNAACTQVAMNQTLANDILLYMHSNTFFHATLVHEVKQQGEPSKLRWSGTGVGVYEFTVPDKAGPFNTPMYVGLYTDDPDNWTWSSTGAGSGEQLFQEKVYHPK